MKRKIVTLLVVISAFALSSCQEDPTMDELIQDTELSAEGSINSTVTDDGENGNGSQGDGDDKPGG